MSLFSNLDTAGTEAVEDRLGSDYSAIKAGIYTGKVKQFYAGEASSGARSVTLILAGGDFGDREYRETIYVTSGKAKGGKNTYEKDGKTYQLPGFIVANHLSQCTVGCELKDLAFEDKMVNIYDSELKKEVPKSVPVAVDMIGMEVSVAILNVLENKTEKQGEAYVAIADTRETNNIDKVFNTEHRMTVHEAQAKAKDPETVAEFWDKWAEKNTGKQRDKTSKNVGAATGKSGAPTSGGAPASGTAAPRSSLFGPK